MCWCLRSVILWKCPLTCADPAIGSGVPRSLPASAGAGRTAWAVLLNALDRVVISSAERASLPWLAGLRGAVTLVTLSTTNDYIRRQDWGDPVMQFGYAALLAQVIPVIGIALLVEMRQLEKHLRSAENDPEFLRRHFLAQIMPVLYVLAMIALTASEITILTAAADGSQIPHFIEPLLKFAIAVTFLISPVLWLTRLYHVSPLVNAIIHGVAALVIPVILLMGYLVGLFAVTSQVVAQPIYQSGDEPTVDRNPRPSCGRGGCPLVPDVAFYQWDLDLRARAAITTTFADKIEIYDFHHGGARGSLQYVPDSSCQGRIEWVVQADGSSPITGILDDKQRNALFDVPIVKQPEKITISAQRTDNQPCTIAFRWDDPRY